MIHLMAEKIQGGSKKQIRVRKPPVAPNSREGTLNYDDDYYIPIASNDSQWNGIKFQIPKDENTEHIKCITDQESELRVIDLEEESSPLLVLFPELKKEEFNFQNILSQEISTSDVTKMLVGKKPNLALLKPCKRLNTKKHELSPVVELSESEDSIETKKPNKITRPRLLQYRRNSRDADESNNEYDKKFK